MNRVLNQIEFNTGRSYSTQGQRVTAIEVGVEVATCEIFETQFEITTVEFHDVDRHIAGRITISGAVTSDKVMAEYDNGRYVGIQSNLI